MSWLDNLKNKIEALEDKDWRDEYIDSLRVVRGSTQLKSALVSLPLSFAIADQLWHKIGCVNELPCAGMGPEKIMIRSLDYDNGQASMVFEIRNTVPWTHILNSSGRYSRMTDSTGLAVYKSVDFNLIREAAE
jgi:hypothetical protein